MALVLESTRVVVDGQVKPARVFIENGIITAVDTEFSRELPESGVQNFGDAVIMAGLVDSHVHINAPGHREQWEGFPTATKAAAAGGITTVVDMPLNCSPVTTTREALKAKVDHAVDKIWVDVACLGGIVPEHIGEISGLIADGVVGFKAFMVHSGIDDFPHVEEEHIHAAMQELKKVKETTGKDIVFMFHAEVGGPIDEASQRCVSCPPQKYNTFLESRPKSAENQAIATVIRLSEQYQVRTHIVHLSSSEAVEMIREARARGVPITAETTFHYLHFRAEQVPDGATHFKCCPPIREEANRERLWTALADGDIQMVISDHSPCTPDLKLLEQGDFMKAWGGISSLQLGLSIIWTDAKARGFSIPDIARLVCQATAELVGLGKRKGRLAEGYDGDVVVWNPEGTFKVEAEGLRVRNKLSPYEGEELAGCVLATFLRGQKIFDSSCPSLLEETRAGQLLFS